MHQAMQMMIDGLKYDQAHRFAGKKMVVPRSLFWRCGKPVRSGRQNCRRHFGNVHRAGSPANQHTCHTGDGALGAGIMKDIFEEKEEEAQMKTGVGVSGMAGRF